MEIDEVAARLLRQYWVLMLVCILMPLLAIGLTVANQPPMYAASARIVSGSTVPARAKFHRAGARSHPRPGPARPTRFDTPLRILNPRIADHPRS